MQNGGKRPGAGRPLGGIGKAKKAMLEAMPEGLYDLAWKCIEASVAKGNADSARWVIEMRDGKARQAIQHDGGIPLLHEVKIQIVEPA
jgi:hypothetical protein